MERTIKLSKQTETLVNAILDLETLTSKVYSLIREEFSQEDSVDDPTGNDILKVSNEYRDLLDYYLKDRFNFSMMMRSNLESSEAVL